MIAAQTPRSSTVLDLVREVDAMGQDLAKATPYTDNVGVRVDATDMYRNALADEVTADLTWYPDAKLNREAGSVCIGRLAIFELYMMGEREQNAYWFNYLIDDGQRDMGRHSADIQAQSWRKVGSKAAELTYFGDLEYRRGGIDKVRRILELIKEQHLLPESVVSGHKPTTKTPQP